MQDDGGDIQADFPPDDKVNQPFLFGNMVSVAALLHIVDGVTKDLHGGMTDFAACMVHVAALCSLLCQEGPRQAFIQRCVKAGGFGDRAHYFQRTFPLHAEHRWSSFIITMRWLLPLQHVLKETWNA